MTNANSDADRAAGTGGADQTRLALINAALQLFGEKGFDGTSTREIAAAAKANIGSIAYHFGGKEGLRAACADHIVESANAVIAPALENALRLLPGATDPAAARQIFHRVVERVVDFVVARPQASPFIRFVLRELGQPTSALDRIYGGVFEPNHKRLCQLWEKATGEPAEAVSTRLSVFTLVGQVMYFRIGREAVKRRMGWADIGSAEGRVIATAICSNVDAMLDARKE